VNGTASVSIDLLLGNEQGLVFGYQGGKYYYVTVNSGYNVGTNVVGLYYYNGSSSVTISQLTSQSFVTPSTLPAWISLKVVRGGNQFFVYYNGTLIATFTDTSNYLPGTGTQGLYVRQLPLAAQPRGHDLDRYASHERDLCLVVAIRFRHNRTGHMGCRGCRSGQLRDRDLGDSDQFQRFFRPGDQLRG
jgi:hypothetical protein